MIARVAVVPLDVGVGLVVRAEQPDVGLGVGIADRLVGIEAQGLMVADGEAHLFVHVRLDELGCPVAVVAANESGGRDVMKQTGEDDLLVDAILLGKPRALHQVLGGTEAELEEVEQRRLVGHPRQARIVAHQVPLALVRGARDRLSRVALSRGVDDRFDDDPVQLLHHGALGCVGFLQCVHAAIIRPRGTTVKGGVRSLLLVYKNVTP